MVQARIDLLFSHRFDPFAMGHEASGAGAGHTALVNTNSDAGWNVDAAPRCVELRILAPFSEASADRVDGGFHANDAADLLGRYQYRLHRLSFFHIGSVPPTRSRRQPGGRSALSPSVLS